MAAPLRWSSRVPDPAPPPSPQPQGSPEREGGDPAPKRKLTLKEVLKRYGRIAVGFHSAVYVVTLSGVYIALHYGVDATNLLAMLPNYDPAKVPPQSTTFAAAYLVTAVTGPARGVLTVACAPVIARALERRRNKQ